MKDSLAISYRTLQQLPTGVSRPAFDPANVRPGIVHLGLGGFHRAHMARYTHDLMNLRPDSLNWGIIGVGLMPNDRRISEALAPQDNLYTLLERQGEREVASVIGSISNVIFAGDSSKPVLDAVADPDIRIVSLTITEAGYCLSAATKQLDLLNPFIVHDLANPDQPRSAIGILVAAFQRRMMDGLPPPTALSCDNIQHNGSVLRNAVLTLAEQRNPRLASWIHTHARFPESMVDRITPITTADDFRYLETHYGVLDRWPVFCEMFRQWVIKDDFVGAHPDWDLMGAQFVQEVAPYEMMKLRLLNASHLAVAGLGRLMGYVHVDEALRDDSIRGYMRALMERETGPTIPAVPGVDLAAYKERLLDRFSNAKIKDTIDRVNADAPINLLLDPIRDRLKANTDITLLALALAAWMRRVRGEDEAGQPIRVVHPLADLLRSRAIEGGTDPRAILSISALFGDLIDETALHAPLERWLGLLYEVGAKATLAAAELELKF
jgi:mannitol 2-dehydrogenase